MKAICRLFSLGLVGVSFSIAGQIERHPDSTVALILRFEEDESLAWLEAMTNDLEQIFEPAGVAFDVRLHNRISRGQTFGELVVVRFKGRCQADRGARPFEPGPLGAAQITDGIILPFIDVDCEQVHDLISPELACGDDAWRSAKFGQAIARVVAHELYHVLAKRVDHARSGIAKSYFRSADLTGGNLEFEPRQLGLIRSRRSSPSARAFR